MTRQSGWMMYQWSSREGDRYADEYAYLIDGNKQLRSIRRKWARINMRVKRNNMKTEDKVRKVSHHLKLTDLKIKELSRQLYEPPSDVHILSLSQKNKWSSRLSKFLRSRYSYSHLTARNGRSELSRSIQNQAQTFVVSPYNAVNDIL